MNSETIFLGLKHRYSIIIRVFKLLVSLFVYLGDSGFARISNLVGKRRKGAAVVLYLHTVKAEERTKFADLLDDLIHYAKPIPADFTGMLDQGTHYVAITIDDGLESAISHAVRELVKRKIPLTVFIPTAYIGREAGWITKGVSREKVVGIEGIQSLAQEPLATVGSHCITHRRLASLNKEESITEIAGSKSALDSLLGSPVTLLSFPHGSYKGADIDAALRAGYKRVFSILPKLAFASPEEVVCGRIAVQPSDWRIEFRLKVFGAYRWLPAAIWLKRRLRAALSILAGLVRQERIT